MSEIKNDGLGQYGTEPFEQQQFGTAGGEWVNIWLYQVYSVLRLKYPIKKKQRCVIITVERRNELLDSGVLRVIVNVHKSRVSTKFTTSQVGLVPVHQLEYSAVVLTHRSQVNPASWIIYQ